MGPSFVIERCEYLYKNQWRYRPFKGLVTFLTGPAGSGKSSGVESLLYPLGSTGARVMPEVRQCETVRLVFRVSGTRWQASRSGRSTGGQVTFKNLSDAAEPVQVFPVQAAKPGEVSAGDFVLGLLEIPVMRSGAVRLSLVHVCRVMALGQATIATEYLGGLSKPERILLFEVLLGLRDEELDGLENAAAEAESRHGREKRLLNQFAKLRDKGVLADVEAVRAQNAEKTRAHQAAVQRWEAESATYGVMAGEMGRLDGLYRVADKKRRTVRKKADEAATALRAAVEEEGRARGHLEGLRGSLPEETRCSRCAQVLPERHPGCCRQCGQPSKETGAAEKHQEKLARAQARLDHAGMIRATRKDSERAAATAAHDADEAAGAALIARDAYEKQTLSGQRATVHDLEKTAHGLAKEIEQLVERLKEADYEAVQERKVKACEKAKQAACRARDTARSEREQRRKALLTRWSELFLARVREIDPSKDTAVIDPEDFTTLVQGKNFGDSSVAGGPKTLTNIAVLLSLRDLARKEPDVTVPPFVLIDSPFSGFGAQGLDEQTSSRLLQTLTTAADDPSPDGFAYQVVAVTNDPLPRPYPGVREMGLGPEHRYFDHAPPLDS